MAAVEVSLVSLLLLTLLVGFVLAVIVHTGVVYLLVAFREGPKTEE